MTFKVGDKVRIAHNPTSSDIVAMHLGTIGIIRAVVPYSNLSLKTEYYIADIFSYYFEDELELIGPEQLTFIFTE
jgi:hypothetical protein